VTYRKTNRPQKARTPKTYHGIVYSSQFEVSIRRALDVMWKGCKNNKRQVFEFEYETERLPYTLNKHYTPDWPIRRPDGTTIYIESKGLFDGADRTKMLAVREQHPDKEFVFLFQRDSYLNRSSRTKYSDWAKANNFDYAVACIPLRGLFGSHCPQNKINEVLPIV